MNTLYGVTFSIVIVTVAAYIEALGASIGAVDTPNEYVVHPGDLLVAFVCGKPSMHASIQSVGWTGDNSQDCLEDPEQILTYCQRLYPDKQVNNIEPAPGLVKITNWCRFEEANCVNRPHSTHTVRPYKCLYGTFMSDPLLVPENCRFGHVNYQDNQHCEPFTQWNQTAKKECEKTGQQLQSFGALFPCKKDVHHKAMYFSGVEFVCCPKSHGSSESAKGFVIPKGNSNDVPKKGGHHPSDEAYQHYIQLAVDPTGQSEHDRYLDAKASLSAYLHEQEAALEKELAMSTEGLEKMWPVDPVEAAQIQKETQKRFRRLFLALLDQETGQHRQLDSVHQQRVQQTINNHKNQAKHSLEYVLQEAKPELARVVHAMQRTIRTIEKDKRHTVNHFEHLCATDPEEASRQKPTIREHLALLDTELEEALAKLKQVPTLKMAVLAQVNTFLTQYQEIDKSAHDAMAAPIPAAVNRKARIETIIRKHSHSGPLDKKKKVTVVHVAPVFKDENGKEVDGKEVPVFDFDTHKMAGDHHDNAGHAALSDVKGFEQVQEVGETHDQGRVSIVLALCGAGVACLVIIGAVAGFLHHRSSFNRSHAGYTMSVVDMEPKDRENNNVEEEAAMKRRVLPGIGVTASPEEQHLTAMQVNGYENPTYKFFEKAAPKPADP